MGTPVALIARHPWRAAAVAASAGLAVFVLVWFQPQKLLIDEKVNDAAPSPAASARPADSAVSARPESPARPVPTQFRSIDHETTGRVLLVAGSTPGTTVLRFEDLETSNGPDLRVYLSTTPPGGPRHAFDDDFVELGRLKGNIGDQNYDVPAGTDLSRFESVVIWCKRFGVPFAAAPLGDSSLS